MHKRLLFTISAMALAVIILIRCVSTPEKKDLRGPAYAGAETCVNCHRDIYNEYQKTAHHGTSHTGAKEFIKGSFKSPENSFAYSGGITVKMESRDSGLFQAAYKDGKLQEIHRFDVAIGSGRKAQTYLYLKDGKYFELPISYFVPEHSWANSPGYPFENPKFDRLIPSTCFGCHSSMVERKSVEMQGVRMTEQFEKDKVIYGVDCERCHGPAADHVAFHTDNPDVKEAKYITRIAPLSNQLKLDMCAVCHSGLKTPIRPTFGYKPGDAFTDYFYPEMGVAQKATELDVHGTQYQLFTASQCFIQSKNMNCSSCHNPHVAEKQDMQFFSQKCMNCHSEATHNFCKLTTVPKEVLTQNCIDCHMPALPSKKITLLANGKSSPSADLVRTHLIAIYPK